MLFYIGPEFIEVLQSLVANRPADDTSAIVSERPHAYKSKDSLTPLQQVASRLRSLVVVVATGSGFTF
jgi:hypothetical protein